MVEAISRGYPQREIEDAAYIAQKEVEEKKQIVVGVNEFANEVEPPFEMLRLNPELEAQQVQQLKAFRAARSADAAAKATSDVQKAAEGKENLMPFIVTAVKARVTLGEIANALRKVFGEHTH
jgi:methylmalonyl-CoA mutase N-terminal domain/subunit